MAIPSTSGMTVSETTSSAAGQDEQDALALLAADDHLADAQARSPTGCRRYIVGCQSVKPRSRYPSASSVCAACDEQQDKERATDEQPARALAAVGDALVGDDMDELGGAHVPGLGHEYGGHAPGAALRGNERGAR